MSDITLYSARTCPFAQRTRLMLSEKGIDFELIEIDLKNTPAWFQDISPYGKVPTLKQGEDLVWESAIINEYLEEVYPRPSLFPTQASLRAYARFWIDFANVKFVPWFYKLLLQQDLEKRRKLALEFKEHLIFMEQKGLGDPKAGDYWLGDQISLVDLTFYPFFERFCVLTHYRDFGLPEECPRLSAWWNTMIERDSVQKIMNPPEFYLQSYSHYADGSADGSTARDMRSS